MAERDGTPSERRPLAKSSEKFRARTVKMPDSLWARFTSAALYEGEQNISTFVRGCAVIGLEYRERDRAFSAHRGTTGSTPGHPGTLRGNPRGMTAG